MNTAYKKAIIVIVCALCVIFLLVGIFGHNSVKLSDKSIIKIDKNNNTFSSIPIEKLTDELTSTSDALTGNSTEITDCALQKSHSGVVVEQSSKRVLLDENMNEKCFPASTTKVLTALVVLQNLPLDTIVTVPKEAAGVEGSSIYLKEGQKITAEDLLFGLMLRSGNDAAVALAVATSGSVEEFAELMNKTAKDCGAVNSNFVNPHGLQDENHYTTAYDLAMICAKAYEYDEFVRLVDCRKRKILIDGEAHYIGNKNKLLSLYEGANGVKTGYTKTSGRCLVGGACRDGMQLISVVLNYNDMWNDTIRMLDFCFDQYEMVALDEGAFKYRDAENTVVVYANQNVTQDWKDIKYPVRKDGSERLEIRCGL